MSAHEAPTLRTLVRAYLDVWNTGRTGDLDTLVAVDFVRVADPLSESVKGREELRRLVEKTRIDMPDFRAVAEDVLVEGGRAAVRWSMTGTDTGPGDLPPTGRSLTVIGLSFLESHGGVLAREWTLIDGLTALGQMGFSMAPPGAP